MENHPMENLMKSTMENIKDMIDVNTVVGQPVTAYDGTVIIPISRVCFGFGCGGTEFESVRNTNTQHPFGGGSGAGVTIKPVGFLVVKGDSIRLLSVDHHNTYDKIIDTVPQLFDMVKDLFKDDNESNEYISNNPKAPQPPQPPQQS
ncbi:MAG TPA: sporulation protein YtfJ [Clostridium sp.]|nr:sporulation protein YtfJ [Clostridium sp.]